jgi:hypothetical protein
MEVSSTHSYDQNALIPGMNPRYPLDGRLGGPQYRSGRDGERNNFPTSFGNRTSVSSIPQPNHYADWVTSAPIIQNTEYPALNCSKMKHISEVKTNISFALIHSVW